MTHPQLIVWLKVLTPKEIAQRLLNKKGGKNSPGTVKKHLSHIYEKLEPFGVTNRADFMARAHLPCADEEE